MSKSKKSSANVSLDDQEVRLPPGFEDFLTELDVDRVKLMREKAFADPEQLRRFLGTFLIPRIDKMFRILASVALESYGLAASNTTQLRNFHGFVVEELNGLGAELPDGPIPGVNPDILDDFQQKFYALGTLLKEHADGNEALENAYNACAEAISAVIGDLMGAYDYEDDDGDERDEDGDEGEDGAVDDAPVDPEAATEPPVNTEVTGE